MSLSHLQITVVFMILSLNYKSPILKLDMYLCKFEVVRSLKNATNSINSLFGRKINGMFSSEKTNNWEQAAYSWPSIPQLAYYITRKNYQQISILNLEKIIEKNRSIVTHALLKFSIYNISMTAMFPPAVQCTVETTSCQWKDVGQWAELKLRQHHSSLQVKMAAVTIETTQQPNIQSSGSW